MKKVKINNNKIDFDEALKILYTSSICFSYTKSEGDIPASYTMSQEDLVKLINRIYVLGYKDALCDDYEE